MLEQNNSMLNTYIWLHKTFWARLKTRPFLLITLQINLKKFAQRCFKIVSKMV